MENGNRTTFEPMGTGANFDLDAAIQEWKTPFAIREWYSRDDVIELESHLMDLVAEGVDSGLGLEDSFMAASSRVGDEPTLRFRYQKEWFSHNPILRYWKLIAAESAAFSERRQRVVYRVARAYSFSVGIGSLMYLIAFFVFWARGVPLWQQGSSLAGQGQLFTLTWGLQSVFNFIPFKRWSNRTGDWVRLLYGSVVVFLLTTFLYAGFGIANIDGHVGLTVFVFSMMTGPTLWLSQVFARRDPVESFEDLQLG